MDKNNLIFLLHRISGQIKGIEKMISEKRNDLEIIQQIEAIRASLKTVEKNFLLKNNKKNLNKSLAYLLKLIN